MKAPEALDHDMPGDTKLVPFGILNLKNNCTDIIFGTSKETSDFIVDGLELWWNKNVTEFSDMKELVINLDNGPQISSSRTQFIRRMCEFSNKIKKAIHLVYYPPYHSKYNSIERCWGSLENHWNGQLLNSIEKTLGWASTMTWKGIKASVSLIEKIYATGISLTKKEMKVYADQIQYSKKLPKWDLRISPVSG